MHVCMIVCGNTVPTESGMPFKPSVTKKKISLTPRLFSSVKMDIQYFAVSPAPEAHWGGPRCICDGCQYRSRRRVFRLWCALWGTVIARHAVGARVRRDNRGAWSRPVDYRPAFRR
jgi:hypothetical protein